MAPPGIAPDYTPWPCHFIGVGVQVARVPRCCAVGARVHVGAGMPCSRHAGCTCKAGCAAGRLAAYIVHVRFGGCAVSNATLPRAVGGVARFERAWLRLRRGWAISIAGAAMRLRRAIRRAARKPIDAAAPVDLRDRLGHACNLFRVRSGQASDGSSVLPGRHRSRVPTGLRMR